MGQEISDTGFSPDDYAAFRQHMREETQTLKHWFDTRAFDWSEQATVGLELEAWLIDRDHLPAPQNAAFLSALDHPDIVSELSRFNFEINAPARPLQQHVLTQTAADLADRWAACEATGQTLGLRPLAIGILPTVRDEMLQLSWMSDANRYRALNEAILSRRKDHDLHISIEGEDTLDYHCNHIMLEAACTSLQAHLKVNQEEAARLYNAAVVAAAPLIAATANAPYLYGKSLWTETRIPAFEQATRLEGFRDTEGRNVGRVTLGTGYVRHSMMELFLRNLSYEPILPALNADTATLPHLRLQNGTIWRWVRPILGFDSDQTPHLRLEHRVMPAGPSLTDTVANLALCHGLVLGLGRLETPPEDETRFEDARYNFYACAQHGLKAQIRWAGRSVNVQALLLDELLPLARQALEAEGLGQIELDDAFTHTLQPRLRSGLTGAEWQRSFIDCNGYNFQALTERYAEMQATGDPVHSWTV
ncbi:MAG: glutamate--cysteine ligase [Henriciella sp.]